MCAAVMRAVLCGLVLTLAGVPAIAGEVEVIDSEAGFPEGPVMQGETLLYTEYGSHEVSRWDGKAVSVLWTQEGCGPSAVVPYGEALAVTCYDSGEIAVISRQGETLASYDKDADGTALIGPNDGTPDGRGGIYFTTSGPWEAGPIVGRVLHLDPDGTIRALADDLHYANGIALSADGRLLYVNESEAGRVISFAVAEDGSLSDRRLFVRLTDLGEPVGAYPDGIKLGPDGRLYIGQFSAGRILVVDAEGKLLGKVEVPSPAAPNLAFSPDGETLYVTAVDDTANPPYSGKVYALPAP